MKMIPAITVITFCLGMLPCCGKLKGSRPDGADGCDDHGGGGGSGGDNDEDGGDNADDDNAAHDDDDAHDDNSIN
jgi:hypothetical protein